MGLNAGVQVASTLQQVLVGLCVSAAAVAYGEVAGFRYQIPLNGLAVVAPAPTLSLSTDLLAFGGVSVQAPVERSFLVTNTGSTPLARSGITVLGGGFTSAHNCPLSLDASASCSVKVTLTPTSAGGYSGEVRVAYSGQAEQRVALTGEGLVLGVSLAGAALPSGLQDVAYEGEGLDLASRLEVSGEPSVEPGMAEFSVISGQLPAGLALSTAGVISGAPTALTPGAAFVVRVRYKGYSAQQAYSIAVQDGSTKYASLSAGDIHSCAVTQVGGVKCWGHNGHGQLGLGWAGPGNGVTTPSAVGNMTSAVVQVSAGYAHTCVVTVEGAAKCWGYNGSGQLGDGTRVDRSMPVQVVGLESGVASITAGTLMTCAVLKTGEAKCWGGGNAHGQLGDGTTVSKLVPTSVQLPSPVKAIVVDQYTACALTTTGGVLCWGYNSEGQVGDGTKLTRLVPTPVVGLQSGVRQIAHPRTTNPSHVCALTASGGVKCWGANSSGELGDGTALSRVTPVDVWGLTSGVKSIAAGQGHTCALTEAGAMSCWGNNQYGNLGAGISASSAVPVPVLGLPADVVNMSLGSYTTCVVSATGIAKCAGDNSVGELGRGTWSPAFSNVLISVLPATP